MRSKQQRLPIGYGHQPIMEGLKSTSRGETSHWLKASSGPPSKCLRSFIGGLTSLVLYQLKYMAITNGNPLPNHLIAAVSVPVSWARGPSKAQSLSSAKPNSHIVCLSAVPLKRVQGLILPTCLPLSPGSYPLGT